MRFCVCVPMSTKENVEYSYCSTLRGACKLQITNARREERCDILEIRRKGMMGCEREIQAVASY